MTKLILPYSSASFVRVKKNQRIKITSETGGQVANFVALQPESQRTVGQETVRDHLLHSSLQLQSDGQNFFYICNEPALLKDSLGQPAFQIERFSKKANALDVSLPGCSHVLFQETRLGCRDLLFVAMVQALSKSELENWFGIEKLDLLLKLKKHFSSNIIEALEAKTALMIEFRTDYLNQLKFLSSFRFLPGTINFFMKAGFGKKLNHLTFRTELPNNSFVELRALQDFWVGLTSCAGDKASNSRPGKIIVEIK